MVHAKSRTASGFTLVEMSITLVIIGLIVGGILVGQDLIKAAAVRAQISQIEKYQTAVNTFRGKYNALPGDLPESVASQFGFAPRFGAGMGDGNGLLEATVNSTVGVCGIAQYNGETVMFWADLTYAHGQNLGLIDGSFTMDSVGSFGAPTSVSASQVGQYMPAAKIGNGNYVYVWSGGWKEIPTCADSDWTNYFGLSAVIGMATNGAYNLSDTSITVRQAYAIDSKMDDGLPQSGNVLALYDGADGGVWAYGGDSTSLGQSGGGDHVFITGGPVTATSGNSTQPSTMTCYDNGGIAGAVEQYSLGVNNGAGTNCALSFRFQ